MIGRPGEMPACEAMALAHEAIDYYHMAIDKYFDGVKEELNSMYFIDIETQAERNAEDMADILMAQLSVNEIKTLCSIIRDTPKGVCWSGLNYRIVEHYGIILNRLMWIGPVGLEHIEEDEYDF